MAGTMSLALSHPNAPVTKSLSMSTTRIAGLLSFAIENIIVNVSGNRPDRAVTDVVIIGAGFIGMELAEAFVNRGLKTSIVEMKDRLMPRMPCKEMADLLKKCIANEPCLLYPFDAADE